MRKLLVVLAIMAMVVFAGACGASENGGSSAKNPAEKGAPAKAERPTPVETVQVAYRETAAESTARTSFEVTAGQLAGPEASGRTDPATMTGQGVVDFSGVASSMTVSMTGNPG